MKCPYSAHVIEKMAILEELIQSVSSEDSNNRTVGIGKQSARAVSKFSLVKRLAPFSGNQDILAETSRSETKKDLPQYCSYLGETPSSQDKSVILRKGAAETLPIYICSHKASPVYGCSKCGITPFALDSDPKYKYKISVPIHGNDIRIDKPTTTWQWWGPSFHYPEPTIGRLQDTNAALIAVVSFIGGIGAVLGGGPLVGVAAGGVSSFLAVQSAVTKLVDKGYGVELIFPLGLPIGIPRPLPPPRVEVEIVENSPPKGWPLGFAQELAEKLRLRSSKDNASRDKTKNTDSNFNEIFLKVMRRYGTPMALAFLTSAITAYYVSKR